jgi:hypothetical protein
MKPKLLLRLASVVMLLHTIGHTIGALTWDKAPNPALATVIQGMKNEHFAFFGRQVTLGMFFQGYGYAQIGVLLLIVVTLLLCANNITDKLTQKLLPYLIAYLLFFAIIEWIYFFPMPATMSSVAAFLTMLGYRGSVKAVK